MEEKHLTRAILIGADTGEYDAESSMDELSELAKTAGAEELARVLQKREAYEPATVIGEGNRPHHADTGYLRRPRGLP